MLFLKFKLINLKIYVYWQVFPKYLSGLFNKQTLNFQNAKIKQKNIAYIL